MRISLPRRCIVCVCLHKYFFRLEIIYALSISIEKRAALFIALGRLLLGAEMSFLCLPLYTADIIGKNGMRMLQTGVTLAARCGKRVQRAL